MESCLCCSWWIYWFTGSQGDVGWYFWASGDARAATERFKMKAEAKWWRNWKYSSLGGTIGWPNCFRKCSRKLYLNPGLMGRWAEGWVRRQRISSRILHFAELIRQSLSSESATWRSNVSVMFMQDPNFFKFAGPRAPESAAESEVPMSAMSDPIFFSNLQDRELPNP